MDLDAEVCLCFHVSKRKLVNFLRIEKPKRVGQMSECFGAGTGCGWCRTYCQRLFDAWQRGAADGPANVDDDPNSADYAHGRAEYIRAGKGAPPPEA